VTVSKYNQPLGGNEMPRFAGHASMFRLPTQATAQGLDIALVGADLVEVSPPTIPVVTRRCWQLT